MKIAVPMVIYIDVDAVRAGTRALVSGAEVVKAIRDEVTFLTNAFMEEGFEARHVSLETMVRKTLVEDDVLELVGE